MDLFELWVIEALGFMIGGILLMAIVCWFVDQFNKDE